MIVCTTLTSQAAWQVTVLQVQLHFSRGPVPRSRRGLSHINILDWENCCPKATAPWNAANQCPVDMKVSRLVILVTDRYFGQLGGVPDRWKFLTATDASSTMIRDNLYLLSWCYVHHRQTQHTCTCVFMQCLLATCRCVHRRQCALWACTSHSFILSFTNMPMHSSACWLCVATWAICSWSWHSALCSWVCTRASNLRATRRR